MDPSGSHTSDCWHGTAASSCSCGNGSFGTHPFVALQLPLLRVSPSYHRTHGRIRYNIHVIQLITKPN